MIPCPRYLFKTINSLVKFADIMWMITINKALWLGHIDSLSKSTLEEGVVDIKLAERPTSITARLRTMRMVVGLTTGLKVS